MSHEYRISVALLTVACLLGPGALLAAEPEDGAPAVTFDPLTGQPVAVETPPPTEEEEELQADLTAANDLVRAGDYAAADAELAALQERFPDDPRLLFMRGEVVLSLSKPAEALPLLQRAVELDGTRPRLHFQLGMALLRTGDRDGALAAFAKEVEVNDDPQVKIMARLNRTQILAQSGKWLDAAAELEAVLALDPARVEAYGDIASFYLEAGQLDRAQQTLDAGLDKGFRSARHRYVLGTRYYGSENYEAAAGAYRKALALDPDLAEAERGLGGALDQLGQEADAASHLKRYLQLKPGAADADRVRERIRTIEGG